MREKIVLNLKTVFEHPAQVTEVRKNDVTVTLDPNTYFFEYDIKIDYDQNVEIENEGTVNLTYKKYENGIVHMKDVIGIWKTSTSKYKLINNEVKEEYEHTIEIATIAQPLFFTINFKEMKAGYDKIVEYFKEYKTKE